MKTRISIILIVLASLLSSTSCLKCLDTMPLSEDVFIPEKAWENPVSYEEFLSKLYASFSLSGNSGSFGVPDLSAADQGEATFLRSYWDLQQLCTDEAIGSEDNESMRGLYFIQWNSNNNFVALNYTRLFLNIAYANEYIRETSDEKLVSRNTDEELMMKVQGFRREAVVLRAFSYYLLMDLYGNVPFIDETFPIGSFDVVQKDRAFLFSWIEEQLLGVRGALPPLDRAHYGMVSDAMVDMLLARMYLNAEVYVGKARYDDCLDAVGRVLDAGLSLSPKYSDLFCADNHSCGEIIFPLIYDGMHAATFGGTTFLIAASSRSDMNPTSTRGFTQAWSNIRAREPLEEKFDVNDSRAMFWKDGRTRDNGVWYDFTNGWSVVKYSNLNSDGTVGSNTSHADTDFPFFRLAEAYLIYAEAVLRGAKGGSKAKALELVNALRHRAGADEIGSLDLTLDFILDERSRELYWEAVRRTDLIRFNRFTDNCNWPWKNGVYIGMARVPDKFKLYPIPATEVAINPSIKQNLEY